MTGPDTPSASPTDGDSAFDEATVATLEALDEILDALREHDDSVPQWEFCEGFMTALLCTRRDIAPDEWVPVLLGGEDDDVEDPIAPFDSEGQRTRFLMHWLAREAQVRTALQAQVEDLSDPRALEPALLDWRGMLAALPPDDGDAATDAADVPEGSAPSYGQMWALGFLAVTEIWMDEWAPPRDKDIAADMDDALQCLVALAADDTAPPAVNLFDDDAPPSISEQRMNDLGEALFAVYDLHAIAAALGPRVAPAHSLKIGRNDPCPCGSGKKYKKCCGA